MQFVIALIAVLVGAAFCFAGFRFFLLLLPIWGFVVGFTVGTDVVSTIFPGQGAFTTATSWVVGFVVALLFAVFSYLWYWLAVALLGGSVGYIIGASAWGLIGNEQGVIAFGIGLVCAVALAIAVLALNVPKLLVIVLSGLGGAATILTGWFVLSGQIATENIHWTTVGHQISQSWFWLIVWGVLAAAGMLAQLRASAIGPDTYELSRSSYRYA